MIPYQKRKTPAQRLLATGATAILTVAFVAPVKFSPPTLHAAPQGSPPAPMPLVHHDVETVAYAKPAQNSPIAVGDVSTPLTAYTSAAQERTLQRLAAAVAQRTVHLGKLPRKSRETPWTLWADAPHTQAGAVAWTRALPWPWPGVTRCESLNDESWRASADSYARGLFQFLPSTWRSLGGTGDPAAASWRTQYAMAVKLRNRDGLRAWDCARMLGYA